MNEVQAKTIPSEGGAQRIESIGLIMTAVSRDGDESLRKNADVLADALKTER